ncbi:VSP [Giardia lamblia P15]|uniref:VSP n=1 Tax=Giardia intestinalis (strain P15) TaxID=658858 RepID=E1F373_GIAIA|nr:VSP [Giardia lamblia P15]
MLLIALCFMLSALAEGCQEHGDHVVTCQVNKCEIVNSIEICTECKAGGVPIDGFCWPASSPPAALAGCVPGASSGVCTRCSSEGYFLFMGGCYKAGSTSSQTLGDSICETIQDGRCTKCKADGNVFQNKADSPALGSECILCSDTTGANKNTGVANCLKCTAPDSKEGAATCSECAAGTYKSPNGDTCTACDSPCKTCTAAGINKCTSCIAEYYLKDENTCVNSGGCGGNSYADELTMTCKACTTVHEQCTACSFDKAKGKPKCTDCGSNNTPRTSLDGTSTCVAKTIEGCQGAGTPTAKEVFMKQDQTCALCNDNSVSTPGSQGTLNCKTCTKSVSGTNPVCDECLEGYMKNSGNTCDACHSSCATCSLQDDKTKCQTCKTGFFLKGEAPNECILCNDTTNGGREGCSVCSNDSGFKCTDCKTNYRKKGSSSDDYTCEKICEDETACGGTAGACDATVVDDQGNTKHYCSYCGEDNKFPIDGICTTEKGTNTCISHTCGSCAAGFFLYMGGCYDVSKAPGNYMCKIVGKEGICTEAANNKYFVVPGATSTEQSVLACANPLGTLAGGNAYVGVDGCSQCAAPDARSDGGMAVATCTACGEGKKPSKNGNGCVLCSVKDCKSCKADEKCEECSSGFSLENDKCVSAGASGGNKSGLSTGAIAGIAVAAIVVVGGLVGFLCWWFICRGKA